MLTAATITDAQIRAWESDVLESGTSQEKRSAVDLATKALAVTPTLTEALAAHGAKDYSDPRPKIRRQDQRRKYSRGRIASILNARSTAEMT